MAREIRTVDKKVIEDIITDTLRKFGIELEKDEAALMLRLFLSGISKYFFDEPDTRIELGFMSLQKSPDLDELFSIRIIRNLEEGVVNADTMYKYYKGEIITEKKIKGIVEGFVDELLTYSQEQNKEITLLTSKLGKNSIKKRK
jgi:hypothetical protein